YIGKRIIGLVSWVHTYDHLNGWYVAKTGYDYDNGTINSQATSATQHDGNYSASFTARGNVTAVWRWDVTDINNSGKALGIHTTYDAAGSVMPTTDPLNHPSSLSYSPSFAYASPTTATDADGYSSTVQYNFDNGAVTQTQGPPPAGQSSGATQNLS